MRSWGRTPSMKGTGRVTRRRFCRGEKKGSTGFGHGVAVPHVKSPTIDTLKVAIGNSDAGVEFNALDKQPVYSIFLLLSPEESPEDHIDAMEAIFGNLSKDQFRKFLRQATSVEEIVVLLARSRRRPDRSLTPVFSLWPRSCCAVISERHACHNRFHLEQTWAARPTGNDVCRERGAV